MTSHKSILVAGVLALVLLFVCVEVISAQSNNRGRQPSRSNTGNSNSVDYSYRGWGSIPNTAQSPYINALQSRGGVNTFTIPGGVGYYNPYPVYAYPVNYYPINYNYPGNYYPPLNPYYARQAYAAGAPYIYRTPLVYRAGLYGTGYYQNGYNKGPVLFYPFGPTGAPLPAPMGYTLP